MENQIEYNQKDDEEISLIDLFAVLIRYRKLIIIGTLAVSFLAGLYLFVLPVIAPEQSRAQIVVTYNIGVNELPFSLNSELSPENADFVVSMAMRELQSPLGFASLYREFPIFSTNDKFPDTVAAYNKMIQDFFEKNIEISNSADGKGNFNDSIELTLQIPITNIEKSDEFVAAYLSKANEAILGYIIPRIQQIRDSADAALAVTASQPALMDSNQNLRRIAFDAQKYLEEAVMPLYLRGEPFEVPLAQGRLTKLVIVTFAAFFVTVFIAFVLNAVNSIKADPQASKVISDAWRAGK